MISPTYMECESNTSKNTHTNKSLGILGMVCINVGNHVTIVTNFMINFDGCVDWRLGGYYGI